ncbi:uncharacterized protein LOC112573227 [Pomacea canaliculata]|uniref:uncharacterized protein LOC112573227 n=1 Tax=Pomacea canaliculata TaxID=400727 RepID=UPI000D72BE90|nr:uncharacterized protein LOC112573227 [Pomacea canaliculata]
MDCTMFARLLIAFLCVHVGSTCVDQTCTDTTLEKILLLNDTNDFCRIFSDFIECAKASCNITEFPQEFYEQMNTILGNNGLHCDFIGQVSSTRNPSLHISTRMAENNCWQTGGCQAAFERALPDMTSLQELCRYLARFTTQACS